MALALKCKTHIFPLPLHMNGFYVCFFKIRMAFWEGSKSHKLQSISVRGDLETVLQINFLRKLPLLFTAAVSPSCFSERIVITSLNMCCRLALPFGRGNISGNLEIYSIIRVMV